MNATGDCEPGASINGQTCAGDVIYGSSTGLNPSGAPGAQIWGQFDFGAAAAGGDRFGAALAAGDFNGDGKSDLAIGSPGKVVGSTEGGIPFASGIQAGNRFGDSRTAWNFGRNESTVIGTCPVCIVLPRPTADLAIGAPLQSVDGVTGAGAVDVVYGSFANNGLVITNPTILNADTTNIGGPLAGAHFGAAVY
jgi:FG-GAP repeat protein